MKILLCDDEPLIRATLSDDLADAGHRVELASNGDEALKRIEEIAFDCVVTDLAMPGADGIRVVKAARARGADAVMITGHGSVGMAVEAMRAGAFDFLEKPFLGDELVKILARVAEKRAERGKATAAAAEPGSGFSRVVGGVSHAFRRTLDLARRAAATDATLLIVGESGTGKEVMAKAIHEESSRRKKPFVAVSCGAISPTLLDDELFGHEKGAFTDAKTARAGRFEEAEGGTLLLDDIDDIRLDTQVKLLRVLQEREFRRLGGEDSLPLDIRVISASKVDLDLLTRDGRFRNDLLYRLQVLRVDLPPLRERREDIPELLRHFIAKHSTVPPPELSLDTLAAVSSYSWPGNIRQLENAVCRALAMKGEGRELSAADLLPQGGEADPGRITDLTLSAAVRKAEREHIEKILALSGGNRSRTAAILGISRKNLWEKMRALGVEVEE